MKEAYYFPHDANARTDAKILELRAEMGWEGYGLWWALVEQMREAGEYKLSNTLIGGLAMGLAIPKDKLRTMLDLCISVGLLAIEGDSFYSPSLRRRLVALDNKRLARVESARNAAEKRWQSAGNADAVRTHSEGNAPAMRIDATLEQSTLDLTKPEERKEEEPLSLRSEDAADAAASAPEKKIAAEALQPESPPADASHTRPPADVPTRKARPHAYDPADIHPGLVLPFDTADFRALWAGYRQYREEQKLPRFNGGMQEQEALRHLSNLAPDHATATAIISQTIRNGWKNLFKLDEPRPQHLAPHGVAGYGQRPAPALHANPFGRAEPESLAIARAVVVGGSGEYPGFI